MACTAAAMRAITTGEFLQGKQIASFPSKGVTAARLPDSVLRELQKVSAKSYGMNNLQKMLTLKKFGILNKHS